MLTLVFVQALDMHIEEGRWIDGNAAVSLDDSGQIEFVGVLDIHEIRLELRIVGEAFQAAKFVQIGFPAMPDF